MTPLYYEELGYEIFMNEGSRNDMLKYSRAQQMSLTKFSRKVCLEGGAFFTEMN